MNSTGIGISVIAVVALLIVLVTVRSYQRSRRSATLQAKDNDMTLYRYGRRATILSQSETDFFNALIRVVGEQYYVFPHMQISMLLDEARYPNQDWKAARARSSKTSVDFVLCRIGDVSPRLVINLNDAEPSDERERWEMADTQRIFDDSGLKLLAIKNWRSISSADMHTLIFDNLNA
jgi:Protein of unknown function (DUF2726)